MLPCYPQFRPATWSQRPCSDLLWWDGRGEREGPLLTQTDFQGQPFPSQSHWGQKESQMSISFQGCPEHCGHKPVSKNSSGKRETTSLTAKQGKELRGRLGNAGIGLTPLPPGNCPVPFQVNIYFSVFCRGKSNWLNLRAHGKRNRYQRRRVLAHGHTAW